VENVRLGRSGLRVAPISLATWPLADLTDETTAVATIERARDLGVNLFDVAPAFDRGRSEVLLAATIGEEIREHRDDVVIATEGGLRREGELLVTDTTPAALRSDVDGTLRELGVDAIDLYQVPWPDPVTPIDDTVDELSDMVDAGKIRHAGVSVPSRVPLGGPFPLAGLDALQVPSFLFHRDVDGLWLPYAGAHDLGVLVGFPVADGALGLDLGPASLFALPRDRVRDGSNFSRSVLRRPAWGGTTRPLTLRPGMGFGRELRPDPQRVVQPSAPTRDALVALAAASGMPLADLVLAWTLAQPEVHVAIVGAGTPDQLQESVESADLELSTGDLEAIEEMRTRGTRVA
jgi:aryl-alcohol dehydrogenase-like predicted oxidoreductase